jgi:hypothetical protein
MTVTYLGNSQWMGLSTDTKPTGVATGSSFRETDLNHIKFYDGTFWRVPRFGLPSSRKIGWWSALGGTTHGEGLLISSIGAGTQSGVTDATVGRGVQYATGTSAGTWAGSRGPTQTSIRQYNPIFRLKFRLDQDNTGNVLRFFAGLATNTAVLPNTDDPLNAINGFGVLINSTDTTFTIGHNDNSGATVQTAITGTPALDTSVHTIEIIADDGGTRFGLSWDGGAYQYITSNIPTQTGPLNIHAAIYNVTTTSTSWDMFYGELEQDK